MTQHEALLTMFRENGNWITLGQIMRTTLAAEYRARISELRRQGYKIECIKAKAPSDNVYRLIHTPTALAPIKFVEEANGQLVITEAA